jgi:hypothetical protein
MVILPIVFVLHIDVDRMILELYTIEWIVSAIAPMSENSLEVSQI